MFTTLLVVFTSTDRQDGHRVTGVPGSAGAGSLVTTRPLESSSCERRHRSDMLESPDVEEESLDIRARAYLMRGHVPMS